MPAERSGGEPEGWRAEDSRQWACAQHADALAEAIEALLPDEPDAAYRELLTEAVSGYRDGIEAAVAAYRADRSEKSLTALAEAIVPLQPDELIRRAPLGALVREINARLDDDPDDLRLRVKDGRLSALRRVWDVVE